MADYSTNELMAVTAARRLQNGMIVAVGLGLPQIASFLAKATHAPDLTMFYEVGVVNPQPVDPGVGIADPRLWYGNDSYTGLMGTLGEILQKGICDIGFLGSLQLDRYANLNSSIVTEGGLKHLTGSGGAADIATFSKNVFVIMRHEKRKFVEQVDWVTSVGCYKGKKTRVEEGLPKTAGVTVFTNLCVMESGEESGELEVVSIHPGVTVEQLKENTGFDVIIRDDLLLTPEPTEEELSVLRFQNKGGV